MKIYQYDKDGLYIGESIAQVSPLEKDTYLMPRNSTEIEPIIEDGKVSIFEDGEWINKEDIRGDYYSTETKQMIIVNDVDYDISLLTKKQPPSMDHEWSGSDWMLSEVHTAKIELAQTDSIITRQIEDIIEVFSTEQKAALPQNITDSILDKKAKRQAYIDLL